MKDDRKISLTYFLTPLFAVIVLGVALFLFSQKPPSLQTETITVSPLASQISADGIVKSQNQADLHFQTGGKLVYLPFKEGDRIAQGQTIARLDTYALQRQLSSALNTFQSTRDTFDQTVNNSQTGYAQGQQKYQIENLSKSGIGGTAEQDVIDNIIKRVIDQNQANLNNSVIQVELANYALQLASITSPINGVVTHEDVTVAGQNVTPATTFRVADPDHIIFQAYVSDHDIDFVNEGAQATVNLSGAGDRKLLGTVIRVYPQKITLPTGVNAYQVDIQSDDLLANSKLDQSGNAMINTNIDQEVILVPVWAVLSKQYVWVEQDGKAKLRNVKVGKTHESEIEILQGLTTGDKVITNPRSVIAKLYRIF